MSLKRNYSKKLSKTIALAVMAMSVAGFASVASAAKVADIDTTDVKAAINFSESNGVGLASGQGIVATNGEDTLKWNYFSNPLSLDLNKLPSNLSLKSGEDIEVNGYGIVGIARNSDSDVSVNIEAKKITLNSTLGNPVSTDGWDVISKSGIYAGGATESKVNVNIKATELNFNGGSDANDPFVINDYSVPLTEDYTIPFSLENSAISTNGGYNQGSEVTIKVDVQDGDINITNMDGISTTDNSSVTIQNVKDINYKNQNTNARLINAGKSKVEISGKGNINADNLEYGILSSSGSVKINMGGDINLQGSGRKYDYWGTEKYAETIGLRGENINVKSNGDIKINNFYTALKANKDSTIILSSKGDIQLDSLGDSGIDVQNNVNIELTSEEGLIKIAGAGYGIFVNNGNNDSGKITINGNSEILGGSIGIYSANNVGTITINGNTKIRGTSTSASIHKGNLIINGDLNAEDQNRVFEIRNAGSLSVSGKAKITANDALILASTAKGIVNLSQGSDVQGNIKVSGGSELTIDSESSSVKGNIEIDETSSMSYKLSNDSTLRGTINTKKVEYGSKEEILDRFAEEDQGYSSFKELLDDWYGTDKIEECMEMDGFDDETDFLNSMFGVDVSKAGTTSKGKLDLILGKGSVLEGAATGGGDINFTLKDGATWNVTGDSEIATLAGTDGIIKPGEYTVTTQAAAEGTSVNVVGEGDMNAIANKIFYTNYVNGENNLSAKAVIEGEAARESAEMLFKEDNGQGYIDEEKATDTEIFGEYNESINKNTNVTVTETGVWAPTGENSVAGLKGEAGSAINMSNADSLKVDNYSGETTMLYGHDESDPTQIIGGDVTVGTAETGSKITMSTDNKGINTLDKGQVESVLNSMANKLTYEGAAEGENNLTGKLQIAEGLTASSAAVKAGDIEFDKDGKGSLKAGSVDYGAEETAVMGAMKGALLSSALMVRAESNDLLKRMGDVRLAEEDRGLWAKYYGGKYEMDSANAHVSYKAYQLGYDTKAGKNWTVGGAVSYNEGKSGKTEMKNTAVGVYGTWTDDKGQYIDLITKIGWLKNDFDVKAAGYQIADTMKNTGMSMSAEYGKRFENKAGSFLEPNAELTFGHINGKNVNAKVVGGGTTLGVDQDAFNSLVGRLGLRIGHKNAKSSVYAKVALAHEFAGDFDVTFSAPSEPTKKVSVDLKDTWGEFQIGGTTKVGKAGLLYANYQRSFAGDIKEKYRVDAGLRWSF